jgi:hypothetical protein
MLNLLCCILAEHIGTKTAVQIRSHAQKFFNKLEKKKEAGEVPDKGVCWSEQLEIAAELLAARTLAAAGTAAAGAAAAATAAQLLCVLPTSLAPGSSCSACSSCMPCMQQAAGCALVELLAMQFSAQ